MPQIDPQEVLTLIPHQLGYQPDNSLVVAAIHTTADTTTVGAVHRIDLPGRVSYPSVWSWVLRNLADADSIAVVVYLDDYERARDIASYINDRTTILQGAFWVTGEGWAHLDRRLTDLAPLPDSVETVVGARMALRGEPAPARTREEYFGQATAA